MVLYCVEANRRHEIARTSAPPPAAGALRTPRTLQVQDDGTTIRIALDGIPLFDAPCDDTRLAGETGVGLYLAGPDAPSGFRRFEAHPRPVPIPEALRPGAPWRAPATCPVFRSPSRAGTPRANAPADPAPLHERPLDEGPLDGQPVAEGGPCWTRSLGRGRFDVDADGSIRVRASLQRPNPGRTAYSIPWPHTRLADLRVEITPPGTDRGRGDMGRGGFLFLQDPHNYLIVNTWLDDEFAGASLSSFLVLDGREDPYRAVWTNVGRRIEWGRPYRLRTVFDGMHYQVYLDDQPVLYRALTDVYPTTLPLAVRHVGLAANWEWGNDTGSLFRRFEALGPAAPPEPESI
jgi:hypothetical protein